MRTLHGQYLWIKTGPGEEVPQDVWTEGVRLTRVPMVDYTSWLSFIYIVGGAICPFFEIGSNPALFFLFIPLGVIAWATWILFVANKSMPPGCQPGETYHKYKITFI